MLLVFTHSEPTLLEVDQHDGFRERQEAIRVDVMATAMVIQVTVQESCLQLCDVSYPIVALNLQVMSTDIRSV